MVDGGGKLSFRGPHPALPQTGSGASLRSPGPAAGAALAAPQPGDGHPKALVPSALLLCTSLRGWGCPGAAGRCRRCRRLLLPPQALQARAFPSAPAPAPRLPPSPLWKGTEWSRALPVRRWRLLRSPMRGRLPPGPGSRGTPALQPGAAAERPVPSRRGGLPGSQVTAAGAERERERPEPHR